MVGDDVKVANQSPDFRNGAGEAFDVLSLRPFVPSFVRLFVRSFVLGCLVACVRVCVRAFMSLCPGLLTPAACLPVCVGSLPMGREVY